MDNTTVTQTFHRINNKVLIFLTFLAMFRWLLMVKGVEGVEAPHTREAAIGNAHLTTRTRD